LSECLLLSPTAEARRFHTPEGKIVAAPEGWACLPPSDAGLTRRVKAAKPSWQVVEKKGRKTFSLGLWAPAANIAAAQFGLEQERATPTYAKRRQVDLVRRERKPERCWQMS
jgi:hypothetical protein